MSNREDFSLDDSLASDDDDADADADRFIVVPDKRPKPGRKASQAAWSRIEDVLADKRLQQELSDYLDGDDS